MGVRNYAILFLGLPQEELLIPGFVPEEEHSKYRENPDKWLFWSVEHGIETELTTQENNEGTLLIGYLIGNSGAYGCKVISPYAKKLIEAEEEFQTIFKKFPNLYLFNYIN